MIYITGDTHGDFTRFSAKRLRRTGLELTKEDYIIICGDFGLCWTKDKTFEYHCKNFAEKPYTILWVQGNHENYDLLRNYPISQWHGGLVQAIRPSVLHLMRGQLYNICGKRIFTMGGASSHDIRDGILEPDNPDYERKLRQLNAAGALYRVNHRSWWKEELPGEDEYRTAREALDKAGWDVDYIITHCAPTSIALMGSRHNEADWLTDFLQEVQERAKYHYWLFGHYHDNKAIDEKHILLWEQIVRVI